MQGTAPVALVTGSSRGLGKGVAVELAGRGYSVAINYASNSAAASQTTAECEKIRTSEGQQFVTLRADIGSADDRVRLLEECIASLGRIDALVNNAAVAPAVRADITELSEQSFDRVIGVNLKGAFFLTQAVINHWLERQQQPLLPGGFKVVFVGSISADTASGNCFCAMWQSMSRSAGRCWRAPRACNWPRRGWKAGKKAAGWSWKIWTVRNTIICYFGGNNARFGRSFYPAPLDRGGAGMY